MTHMLDKLLEQRYYSTLHSSDSWLCLVVKFIVFLSPFDLGYVISAGDNESILYYTGKI